MGYNIEIFLSKLPLQGCQSAHPVPDQYFEGYAQNLYFMYPKFLISMRENFVTMKIRLNMPRRKVLLKAF